jgi:hypothetical protein
MNTTWYRELYYRYGIPVLAGTFLLSLAGITLFNAWYEYRLNKGTIIAQDIQELADIFERIDKTAGILSFDYQKNNINFLNIKKDGFVGSEVGPLNLVHPEKWEGPYVQDNPTVQGKEYQVVRTKTGYFIVPGEGVTLPNQKVMGKDIIIDESTAVMPMMHEEGLLRYRGKALAAPIHIGAMQEKMVLPKPEAL